VILTDAGTLIILINLYPGFEFKENVSNFAGHNKISGVR
jgi:hypothetical protein